MCLPTNRNYHLQAPVDANALGINTSNAVESVTTAVANALKSVASEKRRHGVHPHIIVEHNYHDHAAEATQEAVDERPARGGVTTPFPLRLHAMLDKLEADGYADVISWQPHGRCFVVRKPKEFKELLPKYFKLSKMASFQRQLNLYGFQRLTRGRDKNGYYHEYFLRGMPGLAQHIQRTKVKGTGVRARSNPASEPHLWEMKWVGTDHDGPAHVSDASVSSELRGSPSPKQSPVARKSDPVASTASLKPAPVAPASASLSYKAAAMSSLPSQQAWAQQTLQTQPGMLDDERVFTQEEQDQMDLIMSFGGKKFHYLDPFEMMQEAQLRKRQYQSVQRDDMGEFVSNLKLDELYSHMDNQMMDDDDTFMDMLERVLE